MFPWASPQYLTQPVKDTALPPGPSFYPGTHPYPGFCLLVASPPRFWLYETFILQGDCRDEYYFFLLSNLTKEREKNPNPSLWLGDGAC